MSREIFSKTMSSIMVFIAFVMVVVNLLFVLVLSGISNGFQDGYVKHLSLTGEYIEKAVIPTEEEVYSDSNGQFKIHPLGSDISEKEEDDFEDMFIKQYINTRFTINGNKFLMNKLMGEYHRKYKGGCPSPLKSPLYMWSTKITHPMSSERKYPAVGKVGSWNEASDAWIYFEENEIPEIKKLMSMGITRSVEIIETPYKDGEFWKTTIRLIYKNGNFIDFDRSLYQDFKVKMRFVFNRKDGKFKNYHPFRYANLVKEYKDPYILFGFHVLEFEKEKL